MSVTPRTGAPDGDPTAPGFRSASRVTQNGSQNAVVRRALLVGTAIVVIGWLLLILLWHDAPFALTFDDAWYYLTIGRNLAEGHGSTFDGIGLTNGYHPLWQLISATPFLVGLDDLAAARALLVLQLLIGWGATLVLVSATVARVLSSWPPVGKNGPAPDEARRAGARTLALTLVLAAGSPFIVKVFVNGLESGIAAACEAALLLIAVRRRGRFLDASMGAQLGVGVLLAVTFLARTDAVFLLAALGIWCIAEAIVHKPNDPVHGLLALFVPPALVIAGYLLVNDRLFGTPFQISGLVKRAPFTVTNIVMFALFLAAAVAVSWLAFRRTTGKAQRFPMAGAFAKQTGWFAAFCVVIIGYYNVLQVQQWLWYYAPVVLYLVLLLVLGVADMTGAALRDAPAGAAAMRAVLPVQMVVGVLLLGLGIYTSLQFFDPNLRSIQIANADAGEWMRTNLPEDARIASWDAGALGYFSHRHVMNIDGVVNSYPYYEASRAGHGKEFWACRLLGFVANHGGNVNGEDPDIRSFIRDVTDPTTAEQARILYVRPFTYSGVLSSTGSATDVGSAELAVHVYAFPPRDVACEG